MTPLIMIRAWVFAAIVAAACGMSTLAAAGDGQVDNVAGTSAQAGAGDSPASKYAGGTSVAGPSTAVRAKTSAKLDDPVKPEPTADEEARLEQEKASQALTRVRMVRGSLFSAGETPSSANGDDHARIAPVMSYTSVMPMEPKKFRKHDIVTVVVREDSNNTSTAKADSQKQQDFDLALQQFMKFSLSNLSLSNSSNPSTLPEVKFKYNNNRQNAADQERTDSTSLRISATIVDVKPNGTLVVEATKQITMDREVQQMTLSGVCRAEDVAVDNTVLSTQLADLKLEKSTTGEVRDGTKRGWLNSLIDKFNPF